MSETLGETLWGWDKHIANSMRALYPCDRCDGTGTMKLTGFIHYAPGSTQESGFVHNKPMSCTECDGAGHITGWTLKMRRIGLYVKERRNELDLSEREMAKILKMDFLDFHYLMRGKVKKPNQA